MRHRNIAFLIADSDQARIVMWDADLRDYRTFAQVRDGPAVERASRVRWPIEDRRLVRKRVRAAFVQVLAEHLRLFAASRPIDGAILVAPAAMQRPLRRALTGVPRVLGQIAKDIAKQDDHALRAWLERAEADAPD